ASSTVSPSTTAAPGLKTTLTRYGQSPAVRIGLSGWRTNNSPPRLVRLVTLSGAQSRFCQGSGRVVPDDDGQFRRVERELCAVEGERRFGPFVRVDVLVAEPVAAPAGGEVVERPVEAVASQEPVERCL